MGFISGLHVLHIDLGLRSMWSHKILRQASTGEVTMGVELGKLWSFQRKLRFTLRGFRVHFWFRVYYLGLQAKGFLQGLRGCSIWGGGFIAVVLHPTR